MSARDWTDPNIIFRRSVGDQALRKSNAESSWVRARARVEAMGFEIPERCRFIAERMPDAPPGGTAVTTQCMCGGSCGEPEHQDIVVTANTENAFWEDPIHWAHEQYARDSEGSRGWASPDPDGVLIHELGHVLFGAQAAAITRKCQVGTLSLPAMTIKHGRDAVMSVSEYAAQDPQEFVAEVFRALICKRVLSQDSIDLYKFLGGELPKVH